MTHVRQAVWLALLLGACAGKAPPLPTPVAAPAAAELDVSLYLIGDGGEPKAGGEPVLQALTAEIASSEAPAVVVFLGDNIYGAGMPPASSPARKEMERRLRDQIDAVVRGGARGIFVPGNHDWDNSGSDGWNAVRRQGAYIREHGDAGRVVSLPRDGCPGPSVVDLGEQLRLIVLDTQWWLHGHDKPSEAECEPGAKEAVVEALRESLSTERHAVVVAHHPLLSSGPHGGHFTWQDHLFPLTRVWTPLWVPLPILGSGYPLARRAGVSSQDLSGSKNERMRVALREAFRENPPLIFAAGHEHTLEILRGAIVPYLLVSGAGHYGHHSPTKRREQTLFKEAASGFLRLDVLRDGRLRLGVLIVDAEARVSEPYATYLNAR